jgi:outer membrane lipoprotein SlyB
MRKIILAAAAVSALSLAACGQDDTTQEDAMAAQPPVEQAEQHLDEAQSQIDAAGDALSDVETVDGTAETPVATETPAQ